VIGKWHRVDKSELLRHWRFRVHRVQTGHYEAGRRYDRMHLWLGVPTLIVGTIVGTAIFASLSSATHEVFPTILVGLLSVASAVLAGLQTFLKYSELAERHKIAGARFADIKHQIEMVAVFQADSPELLESKLNEIEQRWEKIREESPNIPARIWRKIEKTMTLEKDVQTHPNFGKGT
jgi:hypothetical protein